MHSENHNPAAGFDIVIGLNNKPLDSKRSKRADSERIPSVCEKLKVVASKGVGDARNGRACLNHIFTRLLPLVTL